MADKYDQIKSALKEPKLHAKMFACRFGLEAKKHRVLTNGRASRYPYPVSLRSRQHNIYLNSGFTDDMIDFETPPVVGSMQAVRHLKMLEQIIIQHLHNDERLWPLSMAPAPLYQNDLEFLRDDYSKPWDQGNHDYLGNKYGIVKEIMGDVHINFGLDDQLIAELYHRFYQDEYASEVDFRNHLYFKLAQVYYLYQWLFTYLYGASPVTEDMPESFPDNLELPVRSIRASEFGDDNITSERVTYNSLEEHVGQLQEFMDNGTFYSLKEFFGPVRLRGHNQDVTDLKGSLAKGVDYLEFRNFDLDPLSRTGISDDTINFLELLLLNALVTPLPDNLIDRLAKARQLNNEVALQKPKDQTDWMKETASALIADLQTFVEEFNAPREYRLALTFAKRRVEDPSLTISGQLADQIENGNLLSFGLKIANDRYTNNINYQHPLQAISKDYSDDLQQLIRAAIELGVEFNLAPDQVTLAVGDHRESYRAQEAFDFSKGARDFILNIFPEAAAFQEEVS
ncbi:MAG: glutamate--cysteine ligase [Limosilactobacillus oris]|jgi:glutamate--cysteine ligase|uniref:glutamate--cysteine ligase n=1 Tax=Limosilactobacillus oris TaxID=1632 RepID=UPI00242A93FA|nr:glutamate--cysteine ligase [Limosilactobacillus oris]MCH3910288.1 glutamate--cysteine ligase [Limosilactobacillus oris]MCH3939415.1 glutamate--cysteine ligase [Limosilactobacillus oris]MCI1980755.1 glutamate--cysteine ligase [Limosilactobacillus oris]MCI2043149.1 glutamate--cysteine ligase [Limosilactobacillus oris]